MTEDQKIRCEENGLNPEHADEFQPGYFYFHHDGYHLVIGPDASVAIYPEEVNLPFVSHPE